MNTRPSSAARAGNDEVDIAKTFRRIRRRELHSSRSLPASALAIVLIVGILWLLLEVILRLSSRDPFLVSPDDLLAQLTSGVPESWQLWAGIGLLILVMGLSLLWMALAPGWRSKRADARDGILMIVGDRAIASAIAYRVARELGADVDDVTVGLSKRRATITVTGISGVTYDAAAAQREADSYLEILGLFPAPKAKVTVTRHRKVA